MKRDDGYTADAEEEEEEEGAVTPLNIRCVK